MLQQKFSMDLNVVITASIGINSMPGPQHVFNNKHELYNVLCLLEDFYTFLHIFIVLHFLHFYTFIHVFNLDT
jgi:hypothetical protein